MTAPHSLRPSGASRDSFAAFARRRPAWNSKQIRGRLSEWGQKSLSRSVDRIDARRVDAGSQRLVLPAALMPTARLRPSDARTTTIGKCAPMGLADRDGTDRTSPTGCNPETRQKNGAEPRVRHVAGEPHCGPSFRTTARSAPVGPRATAPDADADGLAAQCPRGSCDEEDRLPPNAR